MASLFATFSAVRNRNIDGGTMPVIKGSGAKGFTITTSGTSGNIQDGEADWVAPKDGYMTFYCDSAIWLCFGTAPTAAASQHHYLATGIYRDFSIKEGEKVAVIDAA